MRGGSTSLIAAAALAALALPGCAAVQKYNPLLLIDDPLPSRTERAAPLPKAEQAGTGMQVAQRRQPQPRAGEPAENAELAQAAARLGLSVVGALPEPDTPASALPGVPGSREYTRFYEYALAQIDAEGPRESALLLDPPSIDPAVKPCGDRPSAVLIDLDPASGLLPLVGEARPDLALAGLLGTLRDRGVTIFWISGHGPEAARAIRGILEETALDPTGEDPLILMRFAGESKQKRRVALADTHCLLAIAGDRRADFDELYDHVIDPVMAAPLEVLVGNGWFLAPPPID